MEASEAYVLENLDSFKPRGSVAMVERWRSDIPGQRWRLKIPMGDTGLQFSWEYFGSAQAAYEKASKIKEPIRSCSGTAPVSTEYPVSLEGCRYMGPLPISEEKPKLGTMDPDGRRRIQILEGIIALSRLELEMLMKE